MKEIPFLSIDIKYGFSPDQYLNAVKYSNRSISLPVYAKMTFKDIYYICDTINRIME